MKHKARGFTIVELLIVIVIIAILAAITLVAYNGITNRAYDTTVQSDLSAIARKMELYKIDSTSGAYPYGQDQLKSLNFRMGGKNAYASSPTVAFNLLNCTSMTSPGSDFAMLAIGKSGKKFYVSSNASGVQEYKGSVSWDGSNLATMCQSVLALSSGNGAGYSAVDTTAGPWRAWVG